MPCFICETCGTQFAERASPPPHCPICEDERQYVGWQGQRWTTHSELGQRHALHIADDAGLLGIDLPGFGIPQRALLLPTDAGNLLWECVSLVTRQAVEAVQARGGVDRIVISHPHFYSAMVEWSDALGGVPILLHEADRQWVQRPSDRIEFWRGDALRLSDDVTLLRVGGHFDGSTALHWKDGPRDGGALFPGDALQVVLDRRHVTFMYSYPNYIPERPRTVRRALRLLEPYDFDRVYGAWWKKIVYTDGKDAVRRSADRYLSYALDDE